MHTCKNANITPKLTSTRHSSPCPLQINDGHQACSPWVYVCLSFHCCVATRREAVGLCTQCLVCAPALPCGCFHFRGMSLVYFPPRRHPLAEPRVCRTKAGTAEEPALQTRALGGYTGCTHMTSYLLMEIWAVPVACTNNYLHVHLCSKFLKGNC